MRAERVAQSAIRLGGRVFTGVSHKEAVFAASLALNLSPGTVWAEVGRQGQGFTSTRGRWLSRGEAWTLARRRGQLRWDHSPPGMPPELQSEDLQ